MSLPPGTRLGAYEILGVVGAGGMGEVYRARDQRLDRDVAVKVLPAALTRDGSRLERFAREARATSALNHPNILTVHDIGTDEASLGGAPFIVSELLEGEDLRGRLEGGPLPLRQALHYAVQIASGLAAAHDKGVVHRDLKPENVFVTADDRIKILDFGLARLELSGHADGATRGPVTEVGVILGTAGYMAPEQVRGEAADHRADLFAFGALLYELLTGRRAFHCDTAAETLAAILKQDPLDAGGAGIVVPPPLDRIVRRCLEKKPEHRFQSAHDLAFALSALPSASSIQASGAPGSPARSRTLAARARTAWMAAMLVLGLIAGGLGVGYVANRPAERPLPVTAAIVLPASAGLSAIAVSPDGRWLAFTAVTSGNAQLWLRALDAAEARPLAGTEGASFPFWSPDGRFIAFAAGGKLKKVSVEGGAPQTLCDAGVFYGGTWNRDGVIVFSMVGFGLYRVPAGGGTPATLIAIDRSNYHSPAFLPDGQFFLYEMLGARPEINGVYVASLDGRVNERLLPGHAGGAVYSATGHLLYVRDGALLAHPFDAGRRVFLSEPATLAAHVARHPNFSRHIFSVSDTGVLVYDPSLDRQSKELVWVDRAGRAITETRTEGGFTTPALSPDESRVVVDRVNPESDSRAIWLHDFSTGRSSRFSFDPNDNVNPVWSPDGARIVWGSNRTGPYSLFMKAASGVGNEQPWRTSGRLTIATSWSTDGRYVVSYELAPGTNRDVWILPVDADRPPFPVVQTTASEVGGTLSPDGRWLSYTSDETGTYEVYVVSFPDLRGRWQVSTQGGIGPTWRRDGRELFYYSRDGQLMSVDVKSGDTFESSSPRPLFGFRSGNGLTFVAPYAPAADGQRFLLNTITDHSGGAPLTLVLNWPALLGG